MFASLLLPLALGAVPTESPKVEFKLAWERGVDAIELDVHQAADGTLVVIHDADTLRTTGKQLRVQDTLAHVLGKLDPIGVRVLGFRDDQRHPCVAGCDARACGRAARGASLCACASAAR